MRHEWKQTVVILAIVVGVIGAGMLISIASGATSTFAARNHESVEEGKEADLYTCGMHPEVIQEGPGLCPICGMRLVPLSSTLEGGTADGSPSGTVTIHPEITQSIGVRYADVRRGPLEISIDAPAHVDYDEDHYAVLSTRSDGWIDKLHVTSPGASVHAGDPLFDFYSPKLYSAQQEYLIALRAGDGTLAAAARQRLELLGVSNEQIESVRRDGVRRALSITAPIDGVVVAIGSSPSGGMSGTSGGGMSATGGMGGMSDVSSGGGGVNSGAGSSGGSSGILREGDYVGSGTQVFAIADISSIWVYAHVYESELQFVREGISAELELDYRPGVTYEGGIDRIYPFLDRQTRDIKVRLAFQNDDMSLLPGMFGRVRFQSRIADDALLIPDEAVINSGDRRIVFVSLGEGRFAPQEVELGPSDGRGEVQVISGLSEGQTVVTSAQFLIDSESRLREAVNKMLAGAGHIHTQAAGSPPSVSAEAGHEHGAMESEEEWPNLAPDDPDAEFRCPMPEDRYYAAEDGECPICGMNLEPHDPEAWAREHAAN